jgi:hypothetical protein
MSRDTRHPGPTCWVTRPLLRIDYALLSPGLAADDSTQLSLPLSQAGFHEGGKAREKVWVRGYQRMDDDASDHFAVVIDLALRSFTVAEGDALQNN